MKMQIEIKQRSTTLYKTYRAWAYVFTFEFYRQAFADKAKNAIDHRFMDGS